MANALKPLYALLMIVLVTLWSAGCAKKEEAGLPYPIDVDETRIGRIHADTPFDASHIAALMPGLEVQSFTSFIEGAPYTVLHMTARSHPVMTITPTSDGTQIASITVHSPLVTAQKHINIGEAFHRIFRCADPCIEGEGPDKGTLICQAPGSQTIFYIFSATLPHTSEKADQHTAYDWPVKEIRWIPDA